MRYVICTLCNVHSTLFAYVLCIQYTLCIFMYMYNIHYCIMYIMYNIHCILLLTVYSSGSSASFKSISDQLAYIRNCTYREIYLVINNIDGSNLRNERSQQV